MISIFFREWEVAGGFVSLLKSLKTLRFLSYFGEMRGDDHPRPTPQIIENIMISMVVLGGGKRWGVLAHDTNH